MRPVTLSELRERLSPGTWRCLSASGREVRLKGVAVDSRRVKPGELFVAVKGERVDSHRFIPEAVRRGAGAVLAESAEESAARFSGKWNTPLVVTEGTRALVGPLASIFLGDPASKLRVAGITGTNGKTTTSNLLWRILSVADGVTPGLLGTVDNIMGPDIRETPVTTTPGPLELHRDFARMEASGARSCVMEVSSHGIVQDRVAGVDFRAAVLTNIGTDHLDYHGTYQAYREAKLRFLSRLSSRSKAILNAEDPSFDLASSRTSASVVPFSLSGWPGLKRCKVESSGYVAVEFADGQGGLRAVTSLLGEHNAKNVCAACCCARALGIDWACIEEALCNFRAPEGRLEEVSASGFRVFVDYAHTPGALSCVLQSLRPLCERSGGRLLVVFGCGGDRDAKKRPRMGKAAETGADLLFVTSDNPRTEDPRRIIEEVLSGIEGTGRPVYVEVDRKDAIRRALSEAQTGDVVLIAGKGHETCQIVGSERLPFDDREVVRQLVKGEMVKDL